MMHMKSGPEFLLSGPGKRKEEMMRNHYSIKKDICTGGVFCYGLQGRGPEMRNRKEKMRRLFWAIVALVMLAAGAMAGRALADESEVYTVYAMLKPGDYVNVRASAGKRGAIIGYLELGDSAQTDGKTKGAWLHLVNLSMEETEGWVHAGYISETEPVQQGGQTYSISASGRVACRKWINGPRRAWAKKGAKVKVYAMGGEWALTNRGYIRAEYLEVEQWK